MNNQQLIEQIRLAFKGVKLNDGISLNMAEYYDSGESEKKFIELSKSDEREDWSKIDDKILEKFQVTFSFTDACGFKFYTPAYMIWAINNFKTSHSIIADFTIYAMDPDHYIIKEIGFNKLFNDEQICAIIKFLEFVIFNRAYFDWEKATVNLEKIKLITNK